MRVRVGRAVKAEVATPHPSYSRFLPEWQMMRDCVEGPLAIEEYVGEYLPMPSGFATQPDLGLAMYGTYALRAQFPEIVEPTIQGMLGIIHKLEAQVELPPEMQYLYESTDGAGSTIEEFHRAITTEILTCGRVGVLADAPPEGGEPYAVIYRAEDIINWAEDRSFFVLSESRLVRTGFVWENQEVWRVLQVEGGRVSVTMYDADGPLRTRTELGDDSQPKVVVDPLPVAGRGGSPLTEIPLVVCSAVDLKVRPLGAPLKGVARASLAIYRLDADYRHQLFMTGQETFVVSGLSKADAPTAVGAGVMIVLESPTATASYVGPTGVGIEKHRQAIIDERENAAALGARVFDTQKGGAESGEALRIRRGATTATLLSVAISSAKTLEKTLRNIAVMVGSDPEKIIVKPNLDFADAKMTPDEALKLVQVWQSGAISYETMYENLQRGDIASMERTAEEEQELVEAEGGGDLGGFAEDEEVGTNETGDVSEEELEELFDPELLADQ